MAMPSSNNWIWIIVGVLAAIALFVWLAKNVNIG